MDALQTLYEGKKIIMGRDKLDVVKGVMQKVGKERIRPITLINVVISSVRSRSYCKIIPNG